jgi:hypothetical protein
MFRQGSHAWLQRPRRLIRSQRMILPAPQWSALRSWLHVATIAGLNKQNENAELRPACILVYIDCMRQLHRCRNFPHMLLASYELHLRNLRCKQLMWVP